MPGVEGGGAACVLRVQTLWAADFHTDAQAHAKALGGWPRVLADVAAHPSSQNSPNSSPSPTHTHGSRSAGPAAGDAWLQRGRGGEAVAGVGPCASGSLNGRHGQRSPRMPAAGVGGAFGLLWARACALRVEPWAFPRTLLVHVIGIVLTPPEGALATRKADADADADGNTAAEAGTGAGVRGGAELAAEAAEHGWPDEHAQDQEGEHEEKLAEHADPAGHVAGRTLFVEVLNASTGQRNRTSARVARAPGGSTLCLDFEEIFHVRLRSPADRVELCVLERRSDTKAAPEVDVGWSVLPLTHRQVNHRELGLDICAAPGGESLGLLRLSACWESQPIDSHDAI